MNRAHLDIVVAQARGGGQEGSRGQGRKDETLAPRKGRVEEVGGENWPRNMGVWNWKIRVVLPEITLLLVCPKLL